MFTKKNLHQNSDSLIGLLTAQCADLEKLLLLAREEENAVRRGDFEKILHIIEGRAALGEKLELYQRQIAELRSLLNGAEDLQTKNSLISKTEELVGKIIRHDTKTKSSLILIRNAKLAELGEINRLQRCSAAYSREPAKGLAFNNNI
jgi:flagellar biosynthesis/type III secretory pathway chaperone